MEWLWNLLGYKKKVCCGKWEYHSEFTPLPFPCSCELKKMNDMFPDKDSENKSDDDVYSRLPMFIPSGD